VYTLKLALGFELFSGLLYLIFVLLICVISPEGLKIQWIPSPISAFVVGVGGVIVLNILIYSASRYFLNWTKRHRSLSSHFVNLILIAYLCFFNFVISAQRIVDYIPAFESTLIAVMNITIYFLGLSLYCAGSYYPKYFDVKDRNQARLNEVKNNLRMWLPFLIPYLLLALIGDTLTLLPETYFFQSTFSLGDEADRTILTLVVTALAILGLIIFSPYFIQKLWLCKPIEDVDLWLRLAKIAQKAQFRCADFCVWTVMGQFHTAAIIGIIPRFRYVMFTERLIDELPSESIEAILVHEIGHSYRKHLFILPFIIFGMFALAALYTLFFYDGIFQYIAIKKQTAPSMLWEILTPMALLIPYALIFGLYYRFIFGFYSRLFERQADLHPLIVGTPLRNMIDALDQIAIVTGNTHNHPSWHHFSVKQRIDFLETVIQEPSKAENHHRRVRFYLILYFVIFVFVSTILLAGSFPEAPLLKNIAALIEKIKLAFILK
jgi:STE24 endopeptidase